MKVGGGYTPAGSIIDPAVQAQERKMNEIKVLRQSIIDTRENMQRAEIKKIDMYEVLKASGKEDTIARLLSMTYLMFTIANSYAEEAIDEAEKIGIMRKKLKTRMVNLRVAFDLFDEVFFAMVGREDMKKAFCEDYDMIKKKLDEFMNSQE